MQSVHKKETKNFYITSNDDLSSGINIKNDNEIIDESAIVEEPNKNKPNYQILVQIKSLKFNPLRQPNPNIKKSIRLAIRSVTYNTKPSISLEEQLEKMFLFPFDYHSLVFDSMKFDIYDHGFFLNTNKKLGRVIVQLSALKQAIIDQKEFEGTFSLETKELLNIQEVAIQNKATPPILNDRNLATEVNDIVEFECNNILTYTEVRSLGILDLVLSQETRDAIKEITVLYNSFFDNRWMLSKLEFLEAYMLLEKYYAQKPKISQKVTGNLIQDVDRMKKAQRYLKFSMASYGSFLFHWFGYGHNIGPLNVLRMNSDKKVVQDFFGLEKEDIICWEYGLNAVAVPNYMVIRDPETNSILSVIDVITDALAHYEQWNGGFVHRGVLRSAQYLVDHSLDDIRAAVIKFNADSIQIIGHSLGASISSIVTLLLREKCKDLLAGGIDIRAWNFATAPCCSHDLACNPEAINFIYNFVNENDIIPRLSYGNLMDFKELVKFAASELKNEEYKKLKSTEKFLKIFTSIDSYRTTLKSKSSSQKLYIPGTIHYLYKGFYRSHIKSSLACYTKDIVCEKSSPDLLTDITLRRNWLFHHFPDRYDKKFKGVITFLLNRMNDKEVDKVENFWKKWRKMDEIEHVSEEGGQHME
ncbi:628_t:CDS:10, partial [Scutellospora calospora]